MSRYSLNLLMKSAWEHYRAGRPREAEQLARQAREQDPNNADALHLLGLLALVGQRPDIAADLLNHAIEIDSSVPEFHKDLGLAMRALGLLDEAITSERRAIELRPNFGEAHFHLGNFFQTKGNVDEAIAAFRKLTELEPTLAPAYLNLGNALLLDNQPFEADIAYRRALDFDPNLARAYSSRGLLLLSKGDLDGAATAARRAIQLAPQFAEPHSNLATILLGQGLVDEAIAQYRQATTIAPDYVEAHSNLLFALHYHPRFTPEQILREHRDWAREFADPLTAQAPPHANDCDSERRLRIGYVSPDLRDHPVGRFIVPAFEYHDRRHLELHCFCDVRKPDDITRQIQRSTDHWHYTGGLSNAAVADLIRANKIDVVVDLSLHSAGNRLMALALKPAPVQMTYLAYPGTSGLSAMDYRLTDARLDPIENGNDRYYSERSLRLDEYWCYNPPEEAPEVNDLPALTAGHVTFGCFNALAKLSDPALVLWTELLELVPGSRLLLHANPGGHAKRIFDAFAANDVDLARIELIPRQKRADYFRSYHRIDIALDPFPFVGGATTCDALWMGVPLVTLAGQVATSRFGVSFLSIIGLEDLIAQNHAQYLKIASSLAGDLPRLRSIRTSMRQRMKDSRLLDCASLARNLENAYRTAWRAWCASRS